MIAIKKNMKCSHLFTLFTGAAPTAMDTYRYFLSLDIVLQDAYGMSETSGPHHLLHPGTAQFMGSVGKNIPGTKTKLKNQDADGNGEVAMYGRNIMMGYLNREDKTAEDIDSEGYMCSGDLGSMNKEGYLYITGKVVSPRLNQNRIYKTQLFSHSLKPSKKFRYRKSEIRFSH